MRPAAAPRCDSSATCSMKSVTRLNNPASRPVTLRPSLASSYALIELVTARLTRPAHAAAPNAPSGTPSRANLLNLPHGDANPRPRVPSPRLVRPAGLADDVRPRACDARALARPRAPRAGRVGP